MEFGDGRAGADGDHHLRGLVVDDASGSLDEPGRFVEWTAEMPTGAVALHGDGVLGADLRSEVVQSPVGGGERAHPHTPVGISRSAWMSAQLCPIGKTLPGFARQAGSKAWRRRFWWSRSAGEKSSSI